VALSEDVSRIATVAATQAAPGEEVAAVLAVESVTGERIYLAAYDDAAGGRTWLALTDDGVPVTSRQRVREAASIAALVEIAEEAAQLDEGAEPRVASLPYLDSLGAGSEIAGGLQAVEELMHDVETNYKLPLE
jgi:hypothetical protein